MNSLGVTVAAVVLGGLVVGPAAGGVSLTRVPVPKGSAIEKELGHTIGGLIGTGFGLVFSGHVHSRWTDSLFPPQR